MCFSTRHRLICPATLRYLTGRFRARRREIGTRWQRLPAGHRARAPWPTCGAATLPQPPAGGTPNAQLAAGFRIGTATAYRSPREAIDVLTTLDGAMKTVRTKAFVILDGTLLPTGRSLPAPWTAPGFAESGDLASGGLRDGFLALPSPAFVLADGTWARAERSRSSRYQVTCWKIACSTWPKLVRGPCISTGSASKVLFRASTIALPQLSATEPACTEASASASRPADRMDTWCPESTTGSNASAPALPVRNRSGGTHRQAPPGDPPDRQWLKATFRRRPRIRRNPGGRRRPRGLGRRPASRRSRRTRPARFLERPAPAGRCTRSYPAVNDQRSRRS